MTFLFPRQLGAMDESDEEMQLISDVSSLDSQLKKAGCPCDESLFVHLFRNLNEKPLAKRLKLWRFRKELLKSMVATQLSCSAASGETAAASPPVIKQEMGFQTAHKRKFEEPPSFQGPSAQILNDRGKPRFRYIENPDGSAPLMSPLHVAFAEKSVELLRKRRTLTGPQLIELWNEEHGQEVGVGRRGGAGGGRATLHVGTGARRARARAGWDSAHLRSQFDAWSGAAAGPGRWKRYRRRRRGRAATRRDPLRGGRCRSPIRGSSELEGERAVARG